LAGCIEGAVRTTKTWIRDGFLAALFACPLLIALPDKTLAGDSQEAKPNCPLYELLSADMLTLEDGKFEIPVALNGRSYPLLVDTGSVQTSITSEVSDELGAKREFSNNGGAFLNNIRTNQQATIENFRIGPLQAGDGWRVLIIPNALVPLTAGGLLGPDFIKDDDVEFDFYRGKFNIFRHNQCAGAVVYWTRDPYSALPIQSDRTHHINVQAQLDGKPVSVVFDTGSPGAIMSLDSARALFGWSATDPRVKQVNSVRINGGAATPFYSFPFGSLNFDGVTVLNPQISLIPQQNFAHGRNADTTIVLGMSILRQLHLYVDYKGNMLYLTSAEAH
jgi:gag-polyprotein putative aspartyl protease/Aspartyl protease